jgi:hypothetical protein
MNLSTVFDDTMTINEVEKIFSNFFPETASRKSTPGVNFINRFGQKFVDKS